ncbi:uncharacterized protein LOC131856103 isoform X3 [Cryptomeria japonica]|uniref:uncharacterized protein LOC131856103 isoform X3 n=1 Tax=Cryptomeria japonica TaxID=3369 RepID=UPI0027DA9CB5|nr:uncharacterized protein LOC131856103 isoform X3 [Cryptomeria japonica]
MAPMLPHLFNLSSMLQDFLTRMRNMTCALHPLRRHRAHPHRQSSAEECCSSDDDDEEEKRSKTTYHKHQEIQQDCTIFLSLWLQLCPSQAWRCLCK